jgi:hypothetical protein
MKYLFIILLFTFSCKSKQVVQPPTPKQDSAQVNNNLPSTLDTEEIINQVIEGIKNGSILIDSCGYMPVDGTIVSPPPSTPRMERIKGRNERKLTKINRRFDLKENKVEARKIIDSIRIITKTVSDTVKTRSAENVKVEKIESKQAIKETRIEQSWKKWLIVGFFVFLFLLIIVLLLLRRMKIL